MSEQTQDIAVSVVIVNYNGGSDILACLASLVKSEQEFPVEIVVVDNGSEDGSPAKIFAQFPQVRLLELAQNRGFAAGCNIGIDVAKGGAILLLNPDTEVEIDAIEKMYRALTEHPEWGIVGAKMLDSNGKPYRAARRFPTARDLAYQATGLARLFSSSRKFNGYLYGEKEIESLSEVDQIEGSCLMISEAAHKKIGNLDERFFIFFEEVDWCKRAFAAGYRAHVVNDAMVVHKISTTMGKYYKRSREVHAQSAMKYFQKHYGDRGLAELRSRMSTALAVRVLLLALPALFGLGNSRKRFSGTLAERRTYTEGLKS